ncbi:methyl-accepting chemotaxis protein [Spirochaeta isovalerica]|uniref:Methyl-accepting chemotaxis protein n=1 Tax=Spirochaeta isovalerica TaxID=150 RepID=A0A841R7L2_9SPIO|nr:methyl-accepting chemotaxis protein [Spirochaeta isovalerica]MBB6479845.1 methyl-accepting chemotaxis protein [Spirochaeta isovalerica]
MTIRFRLFTFVITLSCLLIGVSYFATFITMDILSKTEHIYSDQFSALDTLVQTANHAGKADHILSKSLSGSNQNDHISEIENEIFLGEDRLKSFREIYGPILNDKKELEDLEQFFYKWKTEIIAVSAGRPGMPGLNYQESYEKMTQSLGSLFDIIRNNAEGNYTDVRKYGKNLFITYHVIAASGGILGILILMTIYRSVLRPIRTVSLKVEELYEGNGDLTKRLPVKGNDEMAGLAENLNGFIEKTEKILVALRQSIRKADSVKTGTITSISENSTATTQISASMKSISGQITSLDRQIRGAGESVGNLDGSVNQFETQVSEQVSIVEETTASVTEMISSIGNLSNIARGRKEGTENLREKISEGDQKIQESVSSVKDIHADIDTIHQMVNLISGIAAQTNLLAMNAAIEAAHAGDAGRGFAVVSDEIRKLSETSSAQSKSIRNVLLQTVSNIEKATEASGFTLDIYREIQGEFTVLIDAFTEISNNSSELNTGGTQILQTMEHLNSHSINLKDESNRLKRVNSEMVSVMEEISAISRSIDSSIKEMNRGMDDITGGISEMNSLSEDLDYAMNTAEEQLKLFKLTC